MGRVRRSVPRSRVPLHRLVRTSPDVLRRWLLVAGLGGITAVLVATSIGSAEAARSRWGHTTTVLVTTSPVEAGLPLASLVEERQWPAAIAPTDALVEIEPAATAVADLDPGVPLTASAVRGAGTDGEQRIQVAVPLGTASLSLSEGDRVDLWSTADPSVSGVGGSRAAVTERVAVGAVVATDSSAHHVVVAVTDDEAAAVVEAIATATVTPVVVG